MGHLLRHSLLGGFALFVLWTERRRRARPYVEPFPTHAGRNLAIAGLAAATVHLLETPVVLPVSRAIAQRRAGLTARLAGPRWLKDAVAVLLLDYTLYVWHILTHRVPWLWRFHLVHHVDLDLDATTGLRFHAGELALSIPWRGAQIAVIGVTPRALMMWQSLTLASILFHHSNSRLSPRIDRTLAWLFVTPRMHAIHHAADEVERGWNFSSGLSLWDRLHRTLALDGSETDVRIGVDGYDTPADVRLIRLLEMPVRPHTDTSPASNV
jgi:sterol desaturase/sphingolipid hydroxylase (fatty acid hydroxylase superfamily)